jgi:ABC-type transport system involved in cytochrome c biogenesis permease subunit
MAFPFGSQLFFNISMAIYIVTFLGYLTFTASQNKRLGTASTLLLAIGFILHSIGLVFRWMETHRTGYGYVPLSNMYESLIFFSWTIVLIYLIIEWKYKQKIIGVFVTPFAFLAIALTSIIPGLTQKLRPSSQPFKATG